MDAIREINSFFVDILKLAHERTGFKTLLDRSITPNHYASWMRQVFHQTRENPQLQALATVYFRGHQRSVINKFYAHARSEIGHDQLALNDMKTLGWDIENVPAERPLAATTTLLAFPFFQIQQKDPLGYLGYLYFLEYAATTGGGEYMDALADIGVPHNALSFLSEHTAVDIGHNKLMEEYIRVLVKTVDDINTINYAIEVTAFCYGNMLQQAFDAVDQNYDYSQFGECKEERTEIID